MSQPTLILAGQDCTGYVATWGSLQDVQKLKLSDSTLFSSVFDVVLDNTTGAFTPGGSGSLFPKVGWAGTGATVSRDGIVLYDGFVWDLDADDETSLVKLSMVSSMTQAANTVADLAAAGVNPANAVLALLNQAGLAGLLNPASFSVAAGFFAGHPIDVACPAATGQTCLSLASEIADVCSMDFVLVRGTIYCSPTRPWDGSGLRQPVTGSNTHTFRSMASDASTFANQVLFSWSGGVVTLDDLRSQRAERRVISASVDATASSKVVVQSKATAEFYGGLLLARTSPRHQLLKAVLDETFRGILPTWRFPVDYAGLGLAMAPFEVVEAQLNLDTDETTVTFQSLEATT